MCCCLIVCKVSLTKFAFKVHLSNLLSLYASSYTFKSHTRTCTKGTFSFWDSSAYRIIWSERPTIVFIKITASAGAGICIKVLYVMISMVVDAWILNGTCSCCCRASSICCCCFSSSRAAMFLCSEWAPSSCSLRPLSWLIIINNWNSFSARDSGVPGGGSQGQVCLGSIILFLLY